MAFQGHINNVLCKHPDLLCTAYLDDIIANSNLLEKQREQVQLILAKLYKAGLYLKLSKGEFEKQWNSFVRLIIMPTSIEMEPDRACTIVDWPEPTYYYIIQVFLSFAKFYRCFIRSY
jgi:hypothetical protein